ncbi:MAG: diaminopimelate decarboxylase, partial [Anaerolineae bacterium]
MFHYRQNQLCAGEVELAGLVPRFGSPLYVYHAEDIRRRCRELQTVFAGLQARLHYSVKANGNLSLLQLLHRQGTGFDIVSGGELARLQAAGIPTGDVGFAGVGKTEAEIEQALRAGIAFFNVESAAELARIAQTAARLQTPAPVLLRLNPDVDPHTHQYITTGQAGSKFGLDFETARALCDSFARHPWLTIAGVHLHLGSQIRQIAPYIAAAQKALTFIAERRVAGQTVTWLNLGGGFGVPCPGAEKALSPVALAAALRPLLNGRRLKLVFEPGRWLVARAGALLMTVQYVKQSGGKTFVITDAGMQTFIRPPLYGGQHKIWPIDRPDGDAAHPLIRCDVVGPICESTDFLARDRLLPPVQAGDVLSVLRTVATDFE